MDASSVACGPRRPSQWSCLPAPRSEFIPPTLPRQPLNVGYSFLTRSHFVLRKSREIDMLRFELTASGGVCVSMCDHTSGMVANPAVVS